MDRDEAEAYAKAQDLLVEFAEWLSDGAGDPNFSGKVFTDEWVHYDERDWDQVTADFLKAFAERQARWARKKEALRQDVQRREALARYAQSMAIESGEPGLRIALGEPIRIEKVEAE